MSTSEDYLRMENGSARNASLHAVIDDCRCPLAGEVVSDDVLIATHPKLGEELRKLRLIAAARERASVAKVSDIVLKLGAESQAPHRP